MPDHNMPMPDFQSIILRIAQDSGVTPEEVLREMQAVIDEGFLSEDPAVQAAWRAIPFRGERPTPEEVVLGVANLVREEGR